MIVSIIMREPESKVSFGDFAWGDSTRFLYCGKCGKSLAVSGDIVTEVYEKGEPIYKVILKCPTYHWFNGHDKWVVHLNRYFSPPVWQLHESMYDYGD